MWKWPTDTLSRFALENLATIVVAGYGAAVIGLVYSLWGFLSDLHPFIWTTGGILVTTCGFISPTYVPWWWKNRKTRYAIPSKELVENLGVGIQYSLEIIDWIKDSNAKALTDITTAQHAVKYGKTYTVDESIEKLKSDTFAIQRFPNLRKLQTIISVYAPDQTGLSDNVRGLHDDFISASNIAIQTEISTGETGHYNNKMLPVVEELAKAALDLKAACEKKLREITRP